MLETVGTHGYEEASVRTVLDRAGLYRQAFYDNFSSKEECFALAYEAGLLRLEGTVLEAARSQKRWLGRLRAGLEALLAFVEAEPAVARALIVEVHPAGGPALAGREAAMARARDFLDGARAEAAASPGTPSAPPKLAPEAIVSGIHMVLHSRLAGGAADGFRSLLPEFMFVAVLPYYGVDTARAEMQAARP